MKSVNEIKNFIFENYYKQIGFSKENSYYSMKRLKKRFIVEKVIYLSEIVSDDDTIIYAKSQNTPDMT